jgi:hypothetical protein
MITDGATIQAADYAARHWTGTESGRLVPGAPTSDLSDVPRGLQSL